MPVPLSSAYPSGASTEEIYETIQGLQKEIVLSEGNINVVLRMSPLIQLGQNELQKRLLVQASKNSDRSEKIALIIASVSIIISVIAMGLSYYSSKTDKIWQDREIDILSNIQKQFESTVQQTNTGK